METQNVEEIINHFKKIFSREKTSTQHIIYDIISDIYELELNELKDILYYLENPKEKTPPVWNISTSFEGGVKKGKIDQTKKIRDNLLLRYNLIAVELEKYLEEQNWMDILL